MISLQCEAIVEQHEDELIEFFAHETDNVKDKLCSKRTGNASQHDTWMINTLLFQSTFNSI